MTALHFVVPDGIDDPTSPSGGNVYDRRVALGLSALGWSVYEHAIPGSWPRPEAGELFDLAEALQRIPDGAVVLLDGLIASAACEVLVPAAARLRLVVLVHMPLGDRPPDDLPEDAADAIRVQEGAVLDAATAVVTTSLWSRRRLLELYPLAADRVHVAEPGAEPAALASGTAHGGELLCVAAVIFEKGHDVMLEALGSISEVSWSCRCVGSVERDPVFAAELRRCSVDHGLGDRLSFPGPLTASELDSTYAAADLMVVASRAETYGMVVTEALARGLPVVASEVGGVAEALGHGADGSRPGMLVPPDDPGALAGALRAWLGDAELRDRLRGAARERRRSLREWSTTVSEVAGVLAEVSP